MQTWHRPYTIQYIYRVSRDQEIGNSPKYELVERKPQKSNDFHIKVGSFIHERVIFCAY